ncbi:MAG: 50S ribosomal protein L23 [Bacilli bacterium]|nr:50S ribosomal protein L23 [Bacilli bacterium]
MNNYRDIIKAPLITEKSTELAKDNKYLFKVDVKANKTEIKQAIEAIFKVKVKEVNTIYVKPKTKRVGRYFGKTNRYKKAIVTLAEGNTIDLD